MTELSADQRAGFESVVDEHGLFSWLGIELDAVEDGRVVLRVPYDEKFANLVAGGEGNVHGGVTATLVDTASGFALRSTFEDPAAAQLTTTDLDVSYLRPATDDLIVEAEVLRAGGSMGVTDATVRSTAPNGEEKAVAVGRTSYRLFRGSE
ncbi:PaaI family thioesterase [Halococcus sp. IIIV-5B]|uniref:PaaI family thioesterase n=1 Tax=Halococcus sp. IIIV-5B TaxID=2321230 RepID=UPI000E75F261|nr:PaaI family thioesterase [Halococcus sp. IIIV-5B]RJS98148.1 PaaI family thioesterase [Halococcus sp. IIIV-5B]